MKGTGILLLSLFLFTVLNAQENNTLQQNEGGIFIDAGRQADFSGPLPCQKVIAAYDTLLCIPPPADSSYMKICFHDTITLIGRGQYPQNNTFYLQEDTLCTFIWNFGDNTVDTGRIVRHAYDSVRGYDVTLAVIDQYGCVSNNVIGLRVCIAGDPVTKVNAIPAICANDSITVTTGYGPGSNVQLKIIEYQQSSSLKYDSTTFIPDGGALGGICYNTNVNFNCFNPGQTITSGSDIISVCASMEHSFVGDLEMILICPSGQQALLKQYIHQGQAFLGVPMGGINHATYDCTSPPACITNPAMNLPGEGWTYCWTMNSPLFNPMNNYAVGAQVDSGSYMPDTDFSNLIGCPLNGTWNFQVCDYWAQDNGYVFSWELNLDPSLLLSNWGYTVKVDSCSFNGPFITSHTDSTINLHPTIAGNYTYQITIYDQFGCHSDTTIQLEVKANPVPALMPDTTLCDGSPVTIAASGGGVYNWNNGAATASINVTPHDTTTYAVTVTNNGCKGIDSIAVNVNPIPVISVNPPFPPPLCPGECVNLSASGALTYSWSPSNGLNTTIGANVTANPASMQTYIVSGTDINGCINTDSVIVQPASLPVINLGNDTILCIGLSVLLNPGNSFSSYLWNTGDTSHTLAVAQSGFYSVTVTTSSTCSLDDSVWVNFVPGGMMSIGPDTIICEGKSILLAPDGSYATYQWNNGSSVPAIQVSLGGTYSLSVTRADGCFDADTINLTVTPAPVHIIDTIICTGHTYFAGGSLQSNSGNFTDTLHFMGSCDSIVITHLLVEPLPVNFWPSDTLVCSNHPLILDPGPFSAYLWQNNSTAPSFPVTGTGTCWVKVTDTNGCIGFDTVNVTLNPAYSFTHNFEICQGDSILSGGTYLSVAGTFIDSLSTTLGCDSIIITQLTVNALPLHFLPSDTAFCEGLSILLDAGNTGSSFLWSTGATQQNILISQGGIFFVNIINGNNCELLDSVAVTVYPAPALTVVPPAPIICRDSSVTLFAHGAHSYQWNPSAGLSSPGDSVVVATPAVSTDYSLYGNSIQGCHDTTIVKITVVDSPITSLDSIEDICDGESLDLDAGFCPGCQYRWSSGQFASMITVTNPATYVVTISNLGCAITDSIVVEPCSDFDIPNVFTPNGDGINETFSIRSAPFLRYHMLVFNRWGVPVFESEKSTETWDGKCKGDECTEGVYYYLFRFEVIGTGHRIISGQREGTVTLLR